MVFAFILGCLFHRFARDLGALYNIYFSIIHYKPNCSSFRYRNAASSLLIKFNSDFLILFLFSKFFVFVSETCLFDISLNLIINLSILLLSMLYDSAGVQLRINVR